MTIAQDLHRICLEAFKKFDADIPSQEIDVSQSTQAQFGHYQCNSALRLAKSKKMPPREIAQEVVKHLEQHRFVFDRIEIAGPGFINMHLSSEYMVNAIKELIADPKLGIQQPKQPQKVIVEYSSPNVAKELHVGHLRSTIIGESIARLLEFIGHNVLRLNHVGDWGTQFGMLIAYLKDEQPEVLHGEKEASLSQLMGWYQASKKRFDLDEEFKRMAQLQVVALQKGEKQATKAWETICEISRKGYEQIYTMLDVDLEERGESFYNDRLQSLVDEAKGKGIAELSDGATCIFLDGFLSKDGTPLPMIIQKSDGGFNYDTTDLAALEQRIFEEKAARIIYVVDAGQRLHFEMLFKAAEKFGWVQEKKTSLEHVAFGVVLGADGKKFKTRSGETEKLIDLLNGAIKRAKEIIRERSPGEKEEVLDQTAKVLGLDAVKYADLSCQRIKDYTFSYDRMLRFEGNTAVFLLYSFVRVQGIKRKLNRTDFDASKVDLQITHPSEFNLALHLKRFGEVIEVVEQDLMPHKLCEYLYELAETFNAFFRDCRVGGSEYEDSRLAFCEITAKVLKQGMYLLGLETLDKM